MSALPQFAFPQPAPPPTPEEALKSPEMQALRQLALEEFRPRGREYDATYAMPERNLRALHERGWLSAAVSESLGGKGSNLDSGDKATYLQAIRSVARACPSTAHCLQVHLHTTWTMEKLGTPM